MATQQARLDAFVTRLATLPQQPPNTSTALLQALSQLRQDWAQIGPPPQVATLVVRFTSHLLGETDPPSSKWSACPPWNEACLETLCAFLADALLSQGYDAAVQALSHLHPPSANKPDTRDTLLSPVFSAETPTHLPSAHVVHTLLTLVQHEPSIPVRRAALLALHGLCRVLPAALIASFMPGLVSSLSKLLTSCHHLPAPLVVATLRLLNLVIARAFPVLLPTHKPVHRSFAQVLQSRRPSAAATVTAERAQLSSQQPPAAKSLLTVRDEQWVASASRHVSLRLRLLVEASAGPVGHSSLRARLAMARFAHAMLHMQTSLRIELAVLAVLRLALVELSADPYPVVRDACRGLVVTEPALSAAVDMAVGIVRQGGEEGEHVEQAALDKVRKARDDVFVHKICLGYLRVVCSMSEVESLLHCVGVHSFCGMMNVLLAATWSPALDNADTSYVELDNEVLTAAHSLGEKGLLTALYGDLVHLCGRDENEDALGTFKKRAFAVLVVQSVLRGAVACRLEEDDTSHVRHVYQCFREVLAITAGFVLPNATESLGNGLRVDDEMISLKRCLLRCTALLFEEVSVLYDKQFAKPVRSDLVLTALMGLLQDISHGEEAARGSAMECLKTVAMVTRCADERRLLFRHLNFVVGRICQSLEEKWAGDVLGFVIGEEGDEVSREATALLEATLRKLCDGLAAAGDARALKTLSAIRSVLSTAVGLLKETQGSTEIVGFDSMKRDEGVAQKDLARLRKRLFYYCTEDIPDYGYLTTPREEDADADAEDRWMGGEDDREATLFEAVAINTLDGMRDLLAGRPWKVRAAALECAALAVRLLEKNRTVLLPHAANLLPLIPDQFVVLERKMSAADRLLDKMKKRKLRGKEDAEEVQDLVKYLNSKGAELPVVTNACLLLSAFARHAGGFIRTRFVQLIYPKMRPLLRLAGAVPSLASGGSATVSHGAMAASDACLEAVAGMAGVLPGTLSVHADSLIKFLSVYFDRRHEPKRAANSGQLNKAMVRYEQQRWEKRVRCAEFILVKLKHVDGAQVFVALLSETQSADALTVATDQLYNLRIR